MDVPIRSIFNPRWILAQKIRRIGSEKTFLNQIGSGSYPTETAMLVSWILIVSIIFLFVQLLASKITHYNYNNCYFRTNQFLKMKGFKLENLKWQYHISGASYWHSKKAPCVHFKIKSHVPALKFQFYSPSTLPLSSSIKYFLSFQWLTALPPPPKASVTFWWYRID